MPVAGSDEEKRTNEIGMAIPLLASCDIAGKDITGDALLTQRAIATHLVERRAHYHFTVKGNQPALESDIALLFETRGAPDFVEVTPPDHGRIETRSIWCSTALNDYLDFPHVGQVFMIERESINKKTGALRANTGETEPGDRTGDHEPHTARSFAQTRTGRQPRALEHRKRSLHHRLELAMRIAAESEPASARKTSRVCAASRWAFSSHFRNPLNPSPQ